MQPVSYTHLDVYKRQHQNNVRASVGIVYSFGAGNARAEPSQSPRATAVGMKIPSLGITVTLGANSGAEITDEAPNGIAALAGVHVGDVINAVDGKRVSTPMELAAELTKRPDGDKVKICLLYTSDGVISKLVHRFSFVWRSRFHAW